MIVGIVVAVIVILGAFVWPFQLGKLIVNPNQSWYAVHMNNGVVYVGKIKAISADKIVMTKTYYMQSYGSAQNQQGQPAQFFGLIRQGVEAPLLTDQEIWINRPVVLFWERLSPGSDMVNKLQQAN